MAIWQNLKKINSHNTFIAIKAILYKTTPALHWSVSPLWLIIIAFKYLLNRRRACTHLGHLLWIVVMSTILIAFIFILSWQWRMTGLHFLKKWKYMLLHFLVFPHLIFACFYLKMTWFYKWFLITSLWILYFTISR